MDILKKITPEEISPTLHIGREDSPELGTQGMQQLFDAHPNLNSQILNENAEIQNRNNTAIQAHISDKNNPHAANKAQVGLGNADNTSDDEKPVSAAQMAALSLKTDKVVQEPINQRLAADMLKLGGDKLDKVVQEPINQKFAADIAGLGASKTDKAIQEPINQRFAADITSLGASKTDKVVQEPINQSFAADIADLTANKADISYVDRQAATAKETADAYSDSQNTALQREILGSLIYEVAYFDPLDGKQKTLQEILDGLSLIQSTADTWKEIENKNLTCLKFDSLMLKWSDINNGGW